jgi:hypothetical protein
MGVKHEQPFAIDPHCEDHAYFLGLLATDGTISEATRNRGRVSFELSATDGSILAELASRIPYRSHLSRRFRTTNFRANYESVVLSFHDLGLRRGLVSLGFRAGKKSLTIAPPTKPYHETGFWRGVIDGDGSLGIMGDGRPFLSLVTASEPLRNRYVEFVSRIIGRRPNPNRNRRDNVYNIVLFDESAQLFASTLYLFGGIAIERKARAARSIADWRRSASRPRITFERRRWLPNEDRILLTSPSLRAAAEILNRTQKSVNIRRCRLRNEAEGASIQQ